MFEPLRNAVCSGVALVAKAVLAKADLPPALLDKINARRALRGDPPL